MTENTINEEVYRILDATGIPEIAKDLCMQAEFGLLDRRVEIADVCQSKTELEYLINESSPEIVLVTDALPGEESFVSLLSTLKAHHPDVRFIYFVGELNRRRDGQRINGLGHLVLNGIYDIVEGSINPNIVADCIVHPTSRETAQKYTEGLIDTRAEFHAAATNLKYEGFQQIKKEMDLKNVIIAVYSTKPGTGKTFLSTNLALCLALYAERKVKVALADADLQTLSVGTALGIEENKEYNLYTCLKAAGEIRRDPKISRNEEELMKYRKTIRKCFIKYKKIPNLYVLSGSGFTPQEMDEIGVDYKDYEYILDVAAEEFDIVIVDMNSNAKHKTSYIAWMKSREMLFTMNLDYNNVRNNLRYKSLFSELGILDKVRFVINQNVENTREFEKFGVIENPLKFTAEDIEKKNWFDIYKKIDNIVFSYIQNSNFDGLPIILDDSEMATAKARLAIMEIADDIVKLDEKTIQRLRDKLYKPSFMERHFKSKSGESQKEKKSLFGRKKKPEPEKVRLTDGIQFAAVEAEDTVEEVPAGTEHEI